MLPSKLVYPLILVALLYRTIEIATIDTDTSIASGIVSTVLSVLVSAGVFYVLYVVSKGKWIGDGDYRLGVAIGLFLGGPVQSWLAIFIASLLGLLFALPSILSSSNKMKLKIPFGPMLMGGLFITFLFGQELIDWYKEVFLIF